MRKRITAFITALVMLFSMSSLFAYADNESDAQAALDEIRGEQSALNSELQKGKAVENDLNKEIKALEANIATLNLEISVQASILRRKKLITLSCSSIR